MFSGQIERLKEAGADQAKIDETQRQIDAFKKLYDNPLTNAAILRRRRA